MFEAVFRLGLLQLTRTALTGERPDRRLQIVLLVASAIREVAGVFDNETYTVIHHWIVHSSL